MKSWFGKGLGSNGLCACLTCTLRCSSLSPPAAACGWLCSCLAVEDCRSEVVEEKG